LRGVMKILLHPGWRGKWGAVGAGGAGVLLGRAALEAFLF
jgi:hypothetical protein